MRGLYEVKYSPERMSLLERVKEKRRQRSMFRLTKANVSQTNIARSSIEHGSRIIEEALELPEIKI